VFFSSDECHSTIDQRISFVDATTTINIFNTNDKRTCMCNGCCLMSIVVHRLTTNADRWFFVVGSEKLFLKLNGHDGGVQTTETDTTAHAAIASLTPAD
jgi:hypothetical protein